MACIKKLVWPAAAYSAAWFLVIGLLPIAADGAALTFEDCRRQAAENNAELLSARANLRSAKAQAKAAWSGFLPQLNGDLGYSYDNSAGGDSQSSYSATLSANQNLFNGRQDEGKVAQALANEKIAAAQLDIARAKIHYDLKSAFVGLTYAQAYVELSRQIATRRLENLRIVELRFESGNENKGSALLSRANWNQAKLDELSASNAVLEAQVKLAQVLGREDPAALAVAGDPPLSEPDPSADLAPLVRLTPQHRQVEYQEEASRAAKTIALAPFYPTLSASGTMGKTGDTFFPENSRWSVGLNLSWSLFSGGSDYFGVKSAAANLIAATYNRLAQDRLILSQLRLALNGYVETVEQFRVDQTYREAAALRAEIARSKYNNGLLSFENWDIIENDLISREKNAIKSKRDRVVAEAAYEQLLGQGVLP